MIFDAAKSGLMLWFEQLIPSLLPFMICSNLLISLLDNTSSYREKERGFSKILQKITGLTPLGFYVLFMGHFCGYPAGGKITADLYTRNKISKKEADYLLMIANQSSPAFLASYFVSYILDQPKLIIPIFAIFYSSTIITAIFIRIFSFKTESVSNDFLCADTKRSFMQILDYSIIDAFSTMVRVGGYVILFSILSALIGRLLAGTGSIKYLLISLLEVTNGLSLLKTAPLDTHMRWLVMMACTAFGGLSVMAQIKGMLVGTSLSIKPYLIGKCIYTIVVVILSELLFIRLFFVFQ